MDGRLESGYYATSVSGPSPKTRAKISPLRRITSPMIVSIEKAAPSILKVATLGLNPINANTSKTTVSHPD